MDPDYDNAEEDWTDILTDAALISLTCFAATLQSIELLNGSSFTDSGLACLGLCRQLRSVVIAECKEVTGSFLEPLTEGCQSLVKLSVQCAKGERNWSVGAARAVARRCSLLESLRLPFITDDDVAAFVYGCPLLKSLIIDKSAHVSDTALLAIALGLHRLEDLRLDGSIVTDIGLRDLAEGKCRLTLKRIVVAKDYYNIVVAMNIVTDAGLWSLMNNCPNLTQLSRGIHSQDLGKRLVQAMIRRNVRNDCRRWY